MGSFYLYSLSTGLDRVLLHLRTFGIYRGSLKQRSKKKNQFSISFSFPFTFCLLSFTTFSTAHKLHIISMSPSLASLLEQPNTSASTSWTLCELKVGKGNGFSCNLQFPPWFRPPPLSTQEHQRGWSDREKKREKRQWNPLGASASYLKRSTDLRFWR